MHLEYLKSTRVTLNLTGVPEINLDYLIHPIPGIQPLNLVVVEVDDLQGWKPGPSSLMSVTFFILNVQTILYCI
jgi:hypothetical protein